MHKSRAKHAVKRQMTASVCRTCPLSAALCWSMSEERRSSAPPPLLPGFVGLSGGFQAQAFCLQPTVEADARKQEKQEAGEANEAASVSRGARAGELSLWCARLHRQLSCKESFSVLILLHLYTADSAQRCPSAPCCLPPSGLSLNCLGFRGLVWSAAGPYKEREPGPCGSAQYQTLSTDPPVKPDQSRFSTSTRQPRQAHLT